MRRFRWTDLELRDNRLFPPELLTLLEMYVGPAGMPGEEQFQVLVTDFGGLQPAIAWERFVVGWHYLIIAAFNQADIEAYLRSHVKSPTTRIAARLSTAGRIHAAPGASVVGH